MPGTRNREESKAMPLNRIDMDLMAARGCQQPGCDHKDHSIFFLHPRCHIRAGTWTSYDRDTGLLSVTCKQCKKLVAEIEVAS